MLFHAPNRIAILRAAMKLFASCGHETATVDDIFFLTRRAGRAWANFRAFGAED